LTFVFSQGQRSPPEKSYKNEPKVTWRLPQDQNIGRIEFGKHYWYQQVHSLCAVRIFNEKGDVMKEFKSKDSEQGQTEMTLCNERIVAAQVDADFYSPMRIRLLIYYDV